MSVPGYLIPHWITHFFFDLLRKDFQRRLSIYVSIACIFYSLWVAWIGLKFTSIYQNRLSHQRESPPREVRNANEIEEETNAARRLLYTHVIFTISFFLLGPRLLSIVNAMFDLLIIWKFFEDRWREKNNTTNFWLTVGMSGWGYFMVNNIFAMPWGSPKMHRSIFYPELPPIRYAK